MALLQTLPDTSEAVTATSKPSSFDKLKTFVNHDLDRVNALIIQKMHSSVPLISEVAQHLIQAGGKRLRPCLTLATALLFENTKETRQIGLATAVEFIHTATLLHDDVVDESDLRRGKATANELFGNKSSVLVGDFLFSRAFELMVDDGSMRTLKSLARASSIIAEGEVLQLTTTNNLSTTEDDYIKVIACKTAELFAAACEVSPLIHKRTDAEVKALYDYGYYLGLAFQMIDDALDYSAKQQELGKTIGDDFKEGKMTLPVIHAYQKAPTDEKKFWQRVINDDNQTAEDFTQALAYIHHHQSLTYTLEQAKTASKKAVQSLSMFKDNQAKNILTALPLSLLERVC